MESVERRGRRDIARQLRRFGISKIGHAGVFWELLHRSQNARIAVNQLMIAPGGAIATTHFPADPILVNSMMSVVVMHAESLPNDAVGKMQELLRELDACGCGRPASASLGEYLAEFVKASLLQEDDAARVLAVYNALRYGDVVDGIPLQQVLSSLQSFAERFRALSDEEKLGIAGQIRERFAPREDEHVEHDWHTDAPAGSLTADAPVAGREAKAIEIGKSPHTMHQSYFAEMGDDEAVPMSAEKWWVRRRLKFVAGVAAVLWTFAVLIGGYVWHDPLDAYISEVRFRLGWEEAYNTPPVQRSQITVPQIPRSRSEIDLLLDRASMFDNSNQDRLAINAYEIALTMDPNHAMANNNLAWILLTTEEESLRSADRALPLAKTAVQVENRAPYRYTYLDTLAEAWFQNGDIAKAIELEEQALVLADEAMDSVTGLRNPRDERPFLRKQLEKFRGALNGTNSAKVDEPSVIPNSPVGASVPPSPTPPPSTGPEPPPLPESK